MNLLDIFEGREPHQQAIDRLEHRRIEDLEARMDDCARRGDKEGFRRAKEERDSYHRVNTNEGRMKDMLWDLAERMTRERFIDYTTSEMGMEEAEAAEFWDSINGPLDEGSAQIGDIITCPGDVRGEIIADEGDRWIVRDLDSEFEDDELEFRKSDCKNYVGEAGIGQDIVNKTEKMARATPPSKAGAVASTVKNAAKWLAGKGGPGKEGPTYESAQKKNSKEIDEHGGGGGGPRQWHAYVRAHRADESTNPKLDALIKNIQARVSKDAVKRPEIMKRVAQMVQQADPEVQDALATAQQLVQQYGQGVEPKPTNVNDIKAQARSGNVMAQLPKTSAGTPSYAQQHATFEGWSDAIVAQRTGKPRTPYSVYIKGKKWKDFENDDHAEAVANKLRAKFKAEGRDPSVITIAPTDYDKDLKEAGTAGLEDTIRQLMAPAYEEETGGWFGYTLEKKAPTMARLRNEYSDDLNDIFGNATPEELHQAAQELKAMYGQIEESKEAVFRSHDIEVEYPEGKGHSHIYHRREPYRLSTIFSDANSVAARNRRAKISLFVDGEYIPNYEWQEGVDAPNGGIAEDIGSWIVFDPVTKQIKKRFKTHTAGKSYAQTHGLGFASSEYYFDNIKQQAVAEDFNVDDIGAAECPRCHHNDLMWNDDTQHVECRGCGAEYTEQGDEVSDNFKYLSKHSKNVDEGATIAYIVDIESDYGDKAKVLVNAKSPQDAMRKVKVEYSHEDREYDVWPTGVRLAEKDDPYSFKLEEQTDYQKRRQRERDVDAGKPVARQRQSKQTDYQKRRAEQKRQDDLGEEWSEKYKRSIDCSHPKGFSQKAHCAGRKKNEGMFSPLEENNEARDAVESAIIRRIMIARTDLLKKFGPQKVMDAAQAVADDHADVEEIGTSDVSAFIQQVERYLAMNY